MLFAWICAATFADGCPTGIARVPPALPSDASVWVWWERRLSRAVIRAKK